MIYIPITVDFEEKEFDSFLEKEQIELYFTTDDNGTIVHNFQDWSFLKKFKKLKILKLNQAEILKKFSNNFFTNLYSMDKLEKLIIEYTMISLPDEPLPKNLYPKNFKEYEIKFDSKYLPSDTFEPNKGEDYKDYEGIGDIDDLERIYEWFTCGIPQLYDFPNIEKFKKLEILNFYNIFDTDSFQGHLFEIDNSLFYKKIDIVIHNVGGGLGVKNYLDSKDKWIDVWNFNVGIAIEMNNIFLPHMIKKKTGKIIHVSSINAESGGTMMKPYGGAPAYTCAKAYLNMYVKVVGREVAKSNIIMNGVMPGPIISKGKHWDILSKKKPNFVKNYLSRYHAIERFGKFDEISPFILMLASKYSNYTSGSMISIDGGLL